MKKQMLSGILLCTMLWSNAAAFTDITDSNVQQAASTLDALGIMQGVGNDRFQPNGALTRAQFCKLAVTSLGVEDVSAYQSFTIFPDLPTGHWAAGYVNAAIKDTEISKKQIIRGFADGTFRPNQSITYGEACTMLLRMLGYGVTDIGAFWPDDYISKAQSLGICDHVPTYAASQTVSRGDGAMMLLNTLQATPKEGSALLYNSVAETKVEDSILLATAETDADLSAGQAQFYESGSIVTRRTLQQPASSLVGQRGTVLFDKENTGKVCAFLPDTEDTQVLSVASASGKAFVTTDGTTCKVDNDTPVVLGGEVTTYAESYFDLVSRSLRVYYDADGQIELLVREAAQSSNTFVYGTAQAANIPAQYQVYKHDTLIPVTSLAKYDVITLDTTAKKAYASDDRVAGYLREASPTFSNPSAITLLGKKFTVSKQGAAYFESFQYGDKITVLLDENGIVCAAYPAARVSAPMLGQYVQESDGKASIQLLNGIRIAGSLTDSDMELYLGHMVQVSEQQGGTFSLVGYQYRAGGMSAWNISDNTIGSHTVAQAVRVFETLDNDSAVSEIEKQDIRNATVPSSKIRSYEMDASGTVTAIFLNDYTGDGWQYGIASISSVETDENGEEMRKAVSLKTFADGAGTTMYYSSSAYDASSSVIGLPKGAANTNGTLAKLPVKKLTVIGQVMVENFDGEDGVQTKNGYYALAEDVGVYVSDYGKMIPLRDAKGSCTSFTLYADTDTPQGGCVRVIIGA